MTAPTRNRPTDDKPDPAAIVLVEIGQRYVPGDKGAKTILFSHLIAAVEALREQVEGSVSVTVFMATQETWWSKVKAEKTRADTAKARETEIAGALGTLIDDDECRLDHSGFCQTHTNELDDGQCAMKVAISVLAAMPAKALKRARAVQKVAEHLWIILPLAKGYVDKNNVGNNTQFIADAEESLAALDALGQEDVT